VPCGNSPDDSSGDPKHEIVSRLPGGRVVTAGPRFGGKEMPNPKHKHSRARRDKRRTQKLRVTPPGMSVCPQCHELKLPHYTCLNCGTYKGKAVIQVEEV
jgi:large subunit ribosomal protein L32